MKRLLIIPAAGTGSRLKSPVPKVLFPINGIPMIDYLLNLYATFVDRFVIVLHPSSLHQVSRHCARHLLKIEFELQESPTGMLDAVLVPLKRVRSYQPTSVWITWCDQIAVQLETIQTLSELSSQCFENSLIFPTVTRANPYTHLVRNTSGDIIDILHRREGDVLPEFGESDVGLFCLSGDTYLRLLPNFSQALGKGAKTQERNFLPFIPWLNGRGVVHTFPAHNEIESVGINNASDLLQIETYFRNEKKSPLN
jgi:bifunctional UDP-N-acetylglucosamine pyrophosphorylase/glucosamine-1-phosphate N-acetyltransferase